MVGLAISQSLILTGMVQHGMRQTAEVINQLTSVDRVMHYTKLETEGPFVTLKGSNFYINPSFNKNRYILLNRPDA